MPIDRRTFLQTGALALAAAVSRPSLLANETRHGETEHGPAALFFPAGQVGALKRRIKAEPETRASWGVLRARGEELIQLPTVRSVLDGTRSVSGEKYPLPARVFAEMAWVLGLAWRVDGDQNSANVLRFLLHHVVDLPEWTMPGMDRRQPPWRGDLWTAAFTVACVTALEALDGLVTPEERRQVLGRVVRLGVDPLAGDWLLPERRIHALDSMGHNWWCVCVSAAGVGALATLGYDPRATRWLGLAETALEGFFGYEGQVLHNKPANFDGAGGFYEGVNYADYTLNAYLLYRLARRNAWPNRPLPPRPVLDKVAAFFVHASYPASTGDLSLDFGDSQSSHHGRRSMRLLAALGHAAELSAWYLQRGGLVGDPVALLYLDRAALRPRNELPQVVLFEGIGWAMMRSGWTEDSTLLAMRCGGTWNHAHADAGSFVLWHAGRPLLIDSGMCEYGRREYAEYYGQSRAHNVVLFDGKGQPPEDVHDRGVKFPGRLHDLIDAAGLRYVYADATGPMAQYLIRNYRHWLWIGGVILVVDDLRSHKVGRFDWLLHHAGEARGGTSDFEIVDGPAAARVTVLHPSDVVVRRDVGLAPGEPDLRRSYLAFSPAEPSREQKFLVAIIPKPRGAGEIARVERLEAPAAIGVRLHHGDQVTDVYLNLAADGRGMHANSWAAIDGWETDAYLLALSRQASAPASGMDAVTRCFLVAGSFVRREERVMLSALSKVTAVFQPGREFEVGLHGQPEVEVSLRATDSPSVVRVNGRQTAFEHSTADSLIRLKWRRPAPEKGATT